MTKYRRTVNKNLVFSLIKYRGLTLDMLGKQLNPPLKKATLSLILNPDHRHKPEHRLNEISEFFHVPPEILFPYVQVTDNGLQRNAK